MYMIPTIHYIRLIMWINDWYIHTTTAIMML